MSWFVLEQTPAAYRVEFVLHAAAVAVLAGLVAALAPRGHWAEVAAWVVGGLVACSLVEYLVHRFLLHGVRPFRGWHAAHHDRPTALIGAPLVFGAGAIVLLVLAPAWAWAGLWRSCALTLGVVAGYLAYAATHHATHHWRAETAWLKRRKVWHARHHRPSGATTCCYGVTSAFWDHVFASAGRPVPAPVGRS